MLALALSTACTPLLESDEATFDDGATSWRVLTAPPAPQPGARFGQRIAWHDTELLISAPRQNVRDAKSGAIVENAGAVHVFDSTNQAAPIEFVAPYPDPGDAGDIAELIGSAENSSVDDPTIDGVHGLPLAASSAHVIAGWSGEDSGNARDPTQDDAEDAGAVYVFSRADPDEPPAYLKANEPVAKSWFGHSLSLSGERLVVGALGEGRPETGLPQFSRGGVYVFEGREGRFDDPPWRLPPPEAEAAMFGTAVALDGDVLAIGAPMTRAIGAVYVFRLAQGKVIAQEPVEVPSSATFALFGFSLELAGETLVVGAPGSNVCGGGGPLFRGAVYVFRRREGQWAVDQTLCRPSGVGEDVMGFSLDFRNDRLLVGVPFELVRGTMLLYERDASGSFISDGKPIVPPGLEGVATYGTAVGIGPGFLAGSAPWLGSGRDQSGVVYLFEDRAR